MFKNKKRYRFRKTLLTNYIILTLMAIFSFGPLLVPIFNSFKKSAEIGANPLGPPAEFYWENYREAWVVGFFSTTVLNTLILVAGTVVMVLVFGGMAAYSLSRLKMRGSIIVIAYLLIMSILPVQFFLVPLYSLWHSLGLINNFFGLILIYTAVLSPFPIFLLRSYMLQMPKAFEDAARVDGANEWQVIWRIVIPLSWPGFLATGLVTAMWVWNEFIFALVFLQKKELSTVVISYYQFTNRFGRDWGLTSSAAVIMTFPIIILFLIFQRSFVEGLTRGGIKE